MNHLNRLIMLLLFMLCMSMLSACEPLSVISAWNDQIALKKQITDNNQTGVDLINEGQYSEAIEYLDKAVAYLYKLDPSLIELNQGRKLSEVFDSPFNNLSWAYSQLGDNQKSLANIEKSLLILPNSNTEFVNKGNALYGLNMYDEALDNYDLAIKLDQNSKHAYYGRGIIHYERQEYKEAVKDFDTYLNFENYDMDAASMMVDALLYLREDEKAIALSDKLFQNNLENIAAYKIKGDVIAVTGTHDDIEKFFQLIKDKFPDNMEVYIWLIHKYSSLGQLDNVMLTYEEAVEMNDTNVDLYITMGNLQMDKTLYMESINYYNKAIDINPLDSRAYVSKIKAIYNGKRNLQCIEFGQETLNIPIVSHDIYWFLGVCNQELENYVEAIDYFQKVYEINPNDHEVLAELAYAYLSLENYDKAQDYTQKSLDLYYGNETALFVKDVLQQKSKPLGQQIKAFFTDYYLYKDSVSDLELQLSELDKPNISTEEIADVINRAKKRDDQFTFAVYGNDYDQLTNPSDDDIDMWLTYEEEIIYFRVNVFVNDTDDQMIRLLDPIPDKERKTLVIDLRGNSGGLTESANNILDTLLPEHITSMLIDKNGYTNNYYSDASHIDFEKIYILVDENTASAAELLTLGLKTYLNNVTIVGRNTFGKGVGQQIFEDKTNKIMVFVVNHYWNVKQTNIMDTYIKPDIYIKGNTLENFMKPVKQGLRK